AVAGGVGDGEAKHALGQHDEIVEIASDLFRRNRSAPEIEIAELGKLLGEELELDPLGLVDDVLEGLLPQLEVDRMADRRERDTQVLSDDAAAHRERDDPRGALADRDRGEAADADLLLDLPVEALVLRPHIDVAALGERLQRRVAGGHPETGLELGAGPVLGGDLVRSAA